MFVVQYGHQPSHFTNLMWASLSEHERLEDATPKYLDAVTKWPKVRLVEIVVLEQSNVR